MVERKRPEGPPRTDAVLWREDRNHRRDRGQRTEGDCNAKTAIQAAHDAYGLALLLSLVKEAESASDGVQIEPCRH